MPIITGLLNFLRGAEEGSDAVGGDAIRAGNVAGETLQIAVRLHAIDAARGVGDAGLTRV